MRILQIIGNLHLGGAERVVVDLSKELNKEGIYVFVCSREGGRFEKELKSEEVPYKIISKKDKSFLNYIRELINLVRAEKIDIIHSHLFGNNFYGFITAKLTGCKIIMTIHGMDCLKSRKRKIAYKVLRRYGDGIVVVSDFLKNEFCKVINSKKVTTIYNGIDIKRFSINCLYSKKEELNLSSVYPLLGVVGNIKPVKGYDVLIEAAKKIFSIYENGKLLILGDANKLIEIQYKKELQKLVRKLRLENYILFLDHRDDVSEILSILDIYLLPSRSEGTSLSLIEAMASGRIIVASNVGGNPKLIEDGINGFLIPPEDSEALADKVINLLKDKNVTNGIGERAKALASKDFSLSRMVSEYKTIYNKLVKGV